MINGNGNEIIYRKLSEIEDKLFAFIMETRTKFKNYFAVRTELAISDKFFVFYGEGDVGITFLEVSAPFKIKLDNNEEQTISESANGHLNYVTESGKHTIKVSAVRDTAYNGEGMAPLIPYALNLTISGNVRTSIE